MTPRPLDRLLRQIADTEPEEISCSECFEWLPSAVEGELAGAAPTSRGALLARHLGQCAVCREEYEVLRDFVRSPEARPGPEGGPPDRARPTP